MNTRSHALAALVASVGLLAGIGAPVPAHGDNLNIADRIFASGFEANSALQLSAPGNFALKAGDRLTTTLAATSSAPAAVIVFSKVSGPAGLGVNPNSGVVTWSTGPSDTGTYPVRVRAEDQFRNSDTEDFTIVVTGKNTTGILANRAPELQPIPDQQARVGATFEYTVSASDPDGDSLTFELLTAPSGMTIDATGVMRLIVQPGDVRNHRVAVRARDPLGLADTQTFWLDLKQANRPPVAVDDGYETRESEVLQLTAPGLLDNDSDPDSDALTATLVQDASNGTVDLRPDGSFTYTPDTPPLSPLGFTEKYVVAPPIGSAASPPRIADVDADGTTEVVVRHSNGVAGLNRLAVTNAETGQLKYQSPPYDRAMLTLVSTDVLADIDGDGRLEMISVGGEGGFATTQSGRKLVATEHDGTFKWASEALPDRGMFNDNPVTQWPMSRVELTVADLDQDGTPEIIAGSTQTGGGANGIGLVVFDNQGKLLFSSYARSPSQSITPNAADLQPEVVDLDLDGVPEIVIVGAAFSNRGEVLWHRDDFPVNSYRGNVLAANLDSDPYAELLRTSNFGTRTMAVNHDGSTLWEVDTQNHVDLVGTPLVIADVDDDGAADVMLTNSSGGPGRLQVLNGHDGSLKWQYPADGDPLLSIRSVAATAFDIDRDGDTEVLLPDSNRVIHVLQGSDGRLKLDSGGQQSIFETGLLGPPFREVPMFVDIDNDGASELVFSGTVSNNTLYQVLEGVNDDWAPTGRIWNQKNFHVTNIDPGGSVPRVERPHWLVPGLNQNRVNALLPEERSNATDLFRYAVSDGAETAEADVHLTIRVGGAPNILSSPDDTATVGFKYVYGPVVTDPDPGETFTFALTSGPAGMTMNATTGLIEWVPNALGQESVAWSVTDSSGQSALQSWRIEVGELVNVPDVIGLGEADATLDLEAAGLVTGRVTEVHDLGVPVGQVTAQNPAAGTTAEFGAAVALQLSLGPAPEDTDNDGDGYTENDGDCDDANNQVHPGANDPAGDGIDQNCDGIDGELALQSIVVEPATSLVLSGTRIQFTAEGLRDDDTAINLNGLAEFSSDDTAVVDFLPDGFARSLAPGTAVISARYQGVTGTATVTVVGGVSSDKAPPVAAIESPSAGAEVTAPIDVIGTVTDANLLAWELGLARGEDAPVQIIASGTDERTSASLGSLDPTLLMNGLYILSLDVLDRGGNRTTSRTTVEVDGDYKVGNFTITQEDLSVPLAGLPMTIARSYDSRDKQRGDFGIGWRLILDSARVSANQVLGSGWRVVGGGQSYALTEDDAHLVSVTLPDGMVETFRMKVTPDFSFFVPFSLGTVSFEPINDTRGSLETLDNPFIAIVDAQPGEVQILDDATFEVFNPRLFRYTTDTGLQFVIDADEGLQSVVDNNGVSLIFDDGGISHSSGTRVQFLRDSQGRIREIRDPSGNAQYYRYDGQGNLASHEDPMGNVTTFRYGRNSTLLEVMDPLGNRSVRSEFDDAGRLTAIIDAQGNRMEFTHDLDGREQIIEDQAGNIQRLLLDDEGNVLVRERTANIEGVPVVVVDRYEYDARGNEISHVDPDGVRTEYTYDNDDNVIQTVVDPGGLAITTSATYNALGQILTATDPLGNVTTNRWDDRGNLLSVTDPLGQVTTFTYDDAGRVLTRTDPLGHVTTRQYSPGGQLVGEDVTDREGRLQSRRTLTVDASGNTTSESNYRLEDGVLTALTRTLEYDDANRLVRSVDPLGGVTRWTHNANGQVLTVTDPLNRTRRFVYNVNGEQVSEQHPDGSTVSVTYDERGNKATQTDELGRTTTWEYDALDRMVAVVRPDGAREETVYSPGGRVVATVDARGARTDMEFDSAGRQIRTRFPAVDDALQGAQARPVLEVTLDAAGQMLARTNALGQVTAFRYDALGRITRTLYPDGTTQLMSYDPLSRVASRTDELGRVTTFEYDALGRLLSVSEPEPEAGAGERTTTYAWDMLGNLLSQTDGMGRETRFEYDALGRKTRHILPEGQVSLMSYDAVGNLVVFTDFNGQQSTASYDVMNRQLTRNWADGQVERYTYLDNGLKTSASLDAVGQVMDWDERNRMTAIARSGGETIDYRYDPMGSVTSIATDNQTVSYGYDDLGRLVSVSDANGTTVYGYDLLGNTARIERPNGVTTEVTRDDRNRPVRVAHVDDQGTELLAFDYTYQADGRRISQTLASGDVETYTYDDLGRLVRAQRTGAVAWVREYGYDLVGNRREIVRNGQPEQYQYDANDRLLSAGPVSFAYDGNGNRIARQEGGELTRFDWTAKGTLAAVERNGTVVARYAYDAEGNRVAVTRGLTTQQFLVDSQNPSGFDQVIEEASDGVLQRVNTWGNGLLVEENGATAYPLADALGSQRAQTGANAAVSTTTSYLPFGEVATSSGGPPGRYGFAGEQFDADVQGYYLRARYYDPETGTFLSRDPFLGMVERPETLHPYLYVGADPINDTDPLGLFSLVSVMSALNIRVQTLAARVPQTCSVLTSAKTASVAAGMAALSVNVAMLALTMGGQSQVENNIVMPLPLPQSMRPMKQLNVTGQFTPTSKSISVVIEKESGSVNGLVAEWDRDYNLVGIDGVMSREKAFPLAKISLCGFDVAAVTAGAAASLTKSSTSLTDVKGEIKGFIGFQAPASSEQPFTDFRVNLFKIGASNANGLNRQSVNFEWLLGEFFDNAQK